MATAEAVFAHFGKYGNRPPRPPPTGHTVWERRDLKCDHFRGPGQFPAAGARGPGNHAAVGDPLRRRRRAVRRRPSDAATGDTLWALRPAGVGGTRPGPTGRRTGRRSSRPTPGPEFSYSTGEPVVVSTGAAETAGLDPADRRAAVAGATRRDEQRQRADRNPAVRRRTGPAGDHRATRPTSLRCGSTPGKPARLAVRPGGLPAPHHTGSGCRRYLLDRRRRTGVCAEILPDDGTVRHRVRLDDSFWASPINAGRAIRAAKRCSPSARGGVARVGFARPPDLENPARGSSRRRSTTASGPPPPSPAAGWSFAPGTRSASTSPAGRTE